MNEIISQIPPRFWEDEEWAYENYAELLNLYPNKWDRNDTDSRESPLGDSWWENLGLRWGTEGG